MRLALALWLLTPTLLAGHSDSPPSDSAGLHREILALEQRIGEANFACDYAFFAKVEAAEFVFIDAAGGVTTREEDLAGASTCRRRQGSYSLDDVRVHRYGDVVLFLARATVRTSDRQARPGRRVYRFTDVLVWRDGRWQLVSGQASH
jgi:ketosteroid isomerase-like protein